MSFVYAMSDIHGCLQSFDAALNLVDLSGDNKSLRKESKVVQTKKQL